MLKISRTADGHLMVQSLNGKKLKVHSYERGYRFNHRWWPDDEVGNMLAAIQYELGSPLD